MAGLSSSYPVYAPAEDLEDYLGETVPNAEGLLARASGAVREATKLAFYSVEADGFTPKDTKKADAFHDATILQAAGYFRADIEPGDIGASSEPRVASKSLGVRSITYAVDANASEAHAALMGGALTPEAVSILSQAGLITTSVFTGGGRAYDTLLRRWVP